MTDPVALHIQKATRAARLALSCLHRLLPPHSWRERLVDQGDRGCASHARLPRPDGGTVYAPTEKLPSGNYRTLCEWCRREANGTRLEWVAANPGQAIPKDERRWWPPERMVQAHHEQGHGRFTPQQRANFARYPNLPKDPKAKSA